MLFRIMLTLFFSSSVFIGYSQGNESNKAMNYQLMLKDVDDYNKIESSINAFNPVKIWGDTTEVVSILWSMPLHRSANAIFDENVGLSSDATGKPCGELPHELFILQEMLGDSISFSMLRRYNPALEGEARFAFPTDSLMKWTYDDMPIEDIPRLSVSFPFCINNTTVMEQVQFYMLPVKDPNFNWNDDRLNHIPTLSVKMETNKIAKFNDAEIYIILKKYNAIGYPISIEIKEDGKFQRNQVKDGLRYKRSYQLKDTINIGRKSFKLDSLSLAQNRLYLHSLATTEAAVVPDDVMAKLLPFFSDQKEALVLDFWGTWCAPCIEALPHLRELYESSKEKYDFLSICYDDPQNFDKAKEIFADHKAEWPQLLDPIQGDDFPISRTLDVSEFPTYMIVNREGTILFRNYGTEGGGGLSQWLSSH